MGQIHRHVHERVDSLPDAVRDCDACGGSDTMRIRRSSLRPKPCADDVILKCGECYRIRTHGIPVTRDTYEQELEKRGGRIVDMVDDGPEPSVEENLKALGYLEY